MRVSDALDGSSVHVAVALAATRVSDRADRFLQQATPIRFSSAAANYVSANEVGRHGALVDHRDVPEAEGRITRLELSDDGADLASGPPVPDPGIQDRRIWP